MSKRFDSKVTDVLKRIKADSSYEFNNILAPRRAEALQDKFTRNMLINSVWYGGSDVELKKLYSKDINAFKDTKYDTESLNYFWAQQTDGLNIRKIHFGIPQLISEKMVDLVKANGYEYTVYKDADFNEEDEDNKLRLDNILEDNKFDEQLNEAIETESWGGGVAFKISASEQFTYPILEVIQPDEYEPVIKAGRIIEDIFIQYYNNGNETYKLKERYGVDIQGAYIKYTLYQYTNNEWLEVELGKLKETAELKDVIFYGIKEKLSLYKPNKLPNSDFRGSRLGESDYSGSHGVFDAIDEVGSALIQEFRDAKIKNFWPSDLLPVDPITKTQSILPALKKDFISYTAGIGEKEKPSVPVQIQGDIHSEKYVEAFKKLIETAVNNAGLSPQTLGVTGLESTSASEESQELREKSSIRTGEKKRALWTPALIDLFRKLLIADDIKNNKPIGEYYPNIVFSDYKIETLQDKTSIATQGIAGKSWDIAEAVNYVHDEMPEEERKLMVVKIKIENGINTFTKDEEMIYKKFMADVIQESIEEPNENTVDDVPVDDMEEAIE